MKFTFIIAAIAAPLELGLTYISLRRFGFIGVAWSQVITSLVALILNFFFVQIAMNQNFTAKQSSQATE